MGLSNWKMPDEWCELLSVISLTNTLMSANALTWWKNGDKSELQKCYILFHPTQKALCTLCLFLLESHCCPMRLWYLRDCSAVWNRLMTETRYTVNKKKKPFELKLCGRRCEKIRAVVYKRDMPVLTEDSSWIKLTILSITPVINL